MTPIESVRPLSLYLTLAILFWICPLRSDGQGSIQVQSRLSDMREIAEGNYLVTLDGDKLMNVEVKDGKAKCVKSNDVALREMQGSIRNTQSGVFLIRFQNNKGAMSQVWIFRKDGTAGVRELPDSGELQFAVPVKNDSLTLPKQTK
jgi:hypothetical protein